MTPILPTWVQFIQALAPTFIVIIALVITGWIQYRLFLTGRIKLKLDLFTERFQLIDVVGQIARTVLECHGEQWEIRFSTKIDTESKRLRRFRLLFPEQIGLQVDEPVSLCHDFSTVMAEMEGQRGSPAWPELIQQRREVLNKIEEKTKTLLYQVEDFIRIDWRG